MHISVISTRKSILCFLYISIMYFWLSPSKEENASQRVLEWFYLNREIDTNKWCKIAKGKQKKTIELVHNSAQYSTTYFRVEVKSLYG